MKFYVVASALDLSLRLGCTPSWWQLFKALSELGHEVLITPYVGDPVASLWWRTTRNPASWESKLMNAAIESGVVKPIGSGTQPYVERATKQVIKHWIRPRWRRHVFEVLEREDDVDVVWFINAPLNHITGIPAEIKRRYPEKKVIYYDGDMPSVLAGRRGERKLKMAYYEGADVGEYDAFFVNSEGVIGALEDMGARNVQALHYAVDPDLFQPIDVERQDVDVFYYAHGSQAREERIEFMVAQPSRALPVVDFLVGGRAFEVEFGNARRTGVLSVADWRMQACRSKINLNITRRSHATVHGSSTARPFELAGLGCCVVSDPYHGLEDWFEPDREVRIASSASEAQAVYQWLLDDDAERSRMARAARSRVLADHTYRQRAMQVARSLNAQPRRSRASVGYSG